MSGEAYALLFVPCAFIERTFRYRKPLTCGANKHAHQVANLGHEFQMPAHVEWGA